MSRQNPIAAALKGLYKGEITETEFLAVWNDPQITTEYRSDTLQYASSSRERYIKVKAPNASVITITWGIPQAPLLPDHRTHLYSLAGFYGFVEEGWDFVPAFIRGKLWSPYVLWAWTAYVMAKDLSPSAQRNMLADLRVGQAEDSPFITCKVTGALIPVEFSQTDYVQGRQVSIFGRSLVNSTLFSIHPCKDKWSYYNQIEIRLENRNRLIQLGYYPRHVPLVSLRTGPITGLLHIPQCEVVTEYFPHRCPECHHFVGRRNWRDSKCLWCLEKSYPNCEVKSYSEDALKHVQVQVSLKKPFVMPSHPVKWLTPILLGCELEYNCADEKSLDVRLSLLKHLDRFVIFKHDGSLNSGGFEIVTAPADLPVHKLKFRPVFAEFPEALHITNTTGMHIHLDRNALSPLMLGRMVDFMHNPDNKEFIEVIGERACNNYSQQSQMGYRHVLEQNSGGSRYHTLNISPKNTVEFRIFKSPSTYTQFAKNLEFVVALLQFFRTGWTNIVPKDGRKFTIFLDYLRKENRSKLEERNTSHNLVAYLKEKRVL